MPQHTSTNCSQQVRTVCAQPCWLASLAPAFHAVTQSSDACSRAHAPAEASLTGLDSTIGSLKQKVRV